MPLESDAIYSCPVCGETNAVGIDPSAGATQRLVEDCPVCCRPISLRVALDKEGDFTVIAIVSAEPES